MLTLGVTLSLIVIVISLHHYIVLITLLSSRLSSLHPWYRFPVIVPWRRRRICIIYIDTYMRLCCPRSMNNRLSTFSTIFVILSMLLALQCRHSGYSATPSGEWIIRKPVYERRKRTDEAKLFLPTERDVNTGITRLCDITSAATLAVRLENSGIEIAGRISNIVDPQHLYSRESRALLHFRSRDIYDHDRKSVALAR